MKLCIVLLLVTCLQVSAKSSFAQNVTINVTNASLKQIFSQLTKQTGYNFICDAGLLKEITPISLQVNKAPLKETLQACFANLSVDILFNNDNTVVIKKKEVTASAQKVSAAIAVTGKITDEQNMPIPGATVKIKNTQTAVASDMNGVYKITVPDANSTLVFSSIGYQSKEVMIDGKANIDVVLVQQNTSLNETVVIGYATQQRRDLTGAVSSVNATQLKDIPLSSAIQALEGRLAGVNISTTEGGPNAAVTIKIRGGGSITQDNTPLYVVDGVQIEDALNKISPQDIESVDVLKDAASTSIYGARGANGVVIITTKAGKNMQTVVAYNYYAGINKLANKFQVMNPKEFIEYNWEKTRGTIADSSAFTSQYGNSWTGLDAIRNEPNVDWQQLTFGRTAISQTHNASVTGGDKATSFNISYTNNNEQSVMINSAYKRNLINMRFDHKISDRFKVGMSVNYNNEGIDGQGTSASGNVTNNRLRNSVKYRPFLLNSDDPNNANDDAYFALTNATGYYLIDPLQFANSSYRHNAINNATFSGYASYALTKFLSVRVTGGVNKTTGKVNIFDDYITYNAIANSAGQPIVNIINSNSSSINENTVFTFSNSSFKGQFNKDNNINILLGQENYQVSAFSQTDQVRYFPVGITPEKAFSQLSLGTPTPLYPTAVDSKSRITSYFSRLTYGYKGRYLATFNIRADGSSKFAPDHQWGYFPSGSFAWRISDESFFHKNNTVSDLKLRLSYGLAGNNRINDFLYTSLYRSNATPYSLNNVLYPGYGIQSLANPNLMWESTLSRNAGLDVNLFNSRIQVSLDAYINDTRNLLINVPVAGNSGFTTQLQNVGGLRNRGLELQLSATAFNKKDFRWNINFNIATNHNEVTKLSRVADYYSASSGWGTGNDFLVKVGQPVGTIWGYVADGMYTLDDFNYNPTNHTYILKPGVPDNSASVGTPAPGTKKLKDLNGDGIVNNLDQTIIGNTQPKFTGGLNNQFTYKNFDLSVFVNFVLGNKILNGDKVEFSNAYAGSFSNMTAIMNNRWKTIDANGRLLQSSASVNGKVVPAGAPPDVLAALNKDATIWQPIKGGNYLLLDSWAVENGSFMRINNVTLGYTVPLKKLLKFKTTSLRIYGTVYNLAVITGYSGMDPEVSTKNQSLVTPGVDSSPYPRSRTFLLGANIKF